MNYYCMMNKLTFVNRFVVHTLDRKITDSAEITRKATKKVENLKYGESGRAPKVPRISRNLFEDSLHCTWNLISKQHTIISCMWQRAQ